MLLWPIQRCFSSQIQSARDTGCRHGSQLWSEFSQRKSMLFLLPHCEFPVVCYSQAFSTATMIHSGTLCIQREVTKFPCFGGLVFRAQFQDFLSAFWRSFFAMQLALVSMITITPTLSLSVFSLQRTRLFRTCGELWRTRGELWLYFEMQRRLDLWSFSWSSRRSREAQK